MRTRGSENQELTYECSQCHVEFYLFKSLTKTQIPLCKSCRKAKILQEKGTLWERYGKSEKYRLKKKDCDLRRLYGITLAEFESLLCFQEHKCAICRLPISEIDICVDHDHKLNKHRGLLCHRCNRVIGSCQENEALFKAMIFYISEWTKINA